MIIALLFIFLLLKLLLSTTSSLRKRLALTILFLYAIISAIDFYWLTCVERIPLHPSDPTEYYEKIKNLSFFQVLGLKSSNTFYYIINWFINQFWQNPYWLSIWVKIDNCLLAVILYLILTSQRPKVTKYDYILLFNPFFLVTINRNVRDLYIILFVLIILIGLHTVGNLRIKKRWVYLSLFALMLTRVILFVPLAGVYLYKNWHFYSSKKRLFLSCLLIVGGVMVLPIILQYSLNQMLSSMDFSGEDISDLTPLLQGNFSPSSIIALFKRLITATAVFLFTPNPINFYSNWMQTMSATGSSNIYTGFDNILITLGAWYNYLFIIPYIIYIVFHYKKMKSPLLVFTSLFALLYIVSYLGQTDIRNHNTFIFFLLATLMYAHQPIKLRLKEYATTFLIFAGIAKAK